ncbi:beta-L-arabinofuranosidase domain-containing protein [Butyrivibrio proteoclasticus]|uniref:beta-L-arabinofuranosidase domain-containing protein n=1 Tax=Butyrivibrio proteoclasticus TaxID=43305 RepID=UPI000688E72A|nr:beta-L-arabinofuranosidase domain-containing protein [Butyrivibrio proteoclasticus]
MNHWELVNDKAVKIVDAYCVEAMEADVANMLKLDADRLLAGFRETAGLIAGMDEKAITDFMKGKKRYGGLWEDGMIGGHTLGHLLTALAQAVANPALSDDLKEKAKALLTYYVDSLKECQDLTKGTAYEGYIFAGILPTKEFRDNPALQFDNVEEGKTDLFKESWVPWYTMHKIITGLNAAAILTGSGTALGIANGIALWTGKRAKSWSDQVHRTVLNIEYGGMNDCLYELHRINKELKAKGVAEAMEDPQIIYDIAHYFDDEDLFEKTLLNEKNFFNNVHANTTIPKYIGALSRYESDNSQTRYLDYAKAFWDIVIDKHTYVTGGNSENEHFGEDYVLDKERTHVNNETCNTYNMLKFSRRLFAATGEKKYLDYSERTFINAILASQDHDTGFTTYFQPMATGFHKVFNNLDDNFWCCTGTGYENFTKLQRGIFYKSADKLLVSLYLASQYRSDAYDLDMDCDLSSSQLVKVNVRVKENSMPDDIYFRIPEWVCSDVTLTVDGETIDDKCCNQAALENISEYVRDYKNKDRYVIIPKDKISKNCEITLTLPMELHYENLPDGPDTYAFMYGPFVLSARLGTAKISTTTHGVRVNVSATKTVDSDELKITSEDSVADFLANLNKHLQKVPGTMEFELSGVDKPLTFTTHYNQYKESYGIYWKLEV